MANNKRWEPTFYENEFVRLLQCVLDKGLNSSNMCEKDYRDLYMEFYEAGKVFIEKIAIGNTSRAMLRGIRFDQEEAACMCAEKFFFQNLDNTLAPGMPADIVKRLVKMAKNYIIDIVRMEKRYRYVPIDEFVEKEMMDEPDMQTDSEMSQTNTNDEHNVSEEDEWDMDEAETIAREDFENHTVEPVTHVCWEHLNAYPVMTSEEDLCLGDYVVHKKYGMGCYAGTEEKRFGDAVKRYIKIAYGKNDFLLVPTEKRNLLIRCIGNRVHSTTDKPIANKRFMNNNFAPNVQLAKGWDAIPSNQDLEKNAVDNEMAEAILKVLKCNTNVFEVMAFLGTKLLGYKASELAEELIQQDQKSVCTSILRQTFDLLGLDSDFFDDAAFVSNHMELKHADAKMLSAEISRGSDRAKNKVKKIYKSK